jgi:hypothetical protein
VRTELVEETAARLTSAALAEAPALEPAAFRALVDGADRPTDPLAEAGVRAVRGGRVLVLERAHAPTVEAWAAPPAAALTTVVDGKVRLVPLPAAALAATLERLTCLTADEPAAAAERALEPGESPGRHHSRLVAGDRALEFARADDGWGRIVVAPDGSAAFRPESAADLRRALRHLT